MKHTTGRLVPPASMPTAPRTANAGVGRPAMVATVKPNVPPVTRSGTTSPPTNPADIERKMVSALRAKA